MEEQAAYLQSLKEKAALDMSEPRQRLLAELTDTVSLLCHQVYSLGAVVDGLNESLDEVQQQLSFFELEEDQEDGGLGIDEYYDGSETPLYEVKCPQCGERFAVDETTLSKGFTCPNCGERLVQAE